MGRVHEAVGLLRPAAGNHYLKLMRAEVRLIGSTGPALHVT